MVRYSQTAMTLMKNTQQHIRIEDYISKYIYIYISYFQFLLVIIDELLCMQGW